MLLRVGRMSTSAAAAEQQQEEGEHGPFPIEQLQVLARRNPSGVFSSSAPSGVGVGGFPRAGVSWGF